jgi:hypothetical protein
MPNPPGSTTARGYGYSHAKLRRQWAPHVARGEVVCWRCGYLIHPAARWDLGHDDDDRTLYRGPEHIRCNRLAAARKGNAAMRRNTARQSRW